MNAHENADSAGVYRLLNSPITGGDQAMRHLLKSTITDGYQMESHLIKRTQSLVAAVAANHRLSRIV